MQPQTPSPEAGAPAPSSLEGDPQVQIALGPVLDIYPEGLKPPAESPVPPESDAPEPDEATAPDAESDVAGAASPLGKESETRGTRRRAAEDAYQRGLAEGRATLEREQTERQQQESFRQTQREANERIERLFSDLASPDYATQDRARQAVLQLYSGNRQASALMQSTRQQILLEMAADFANLAICRGPGEAGHRHRQARPRRTGRPPRGRKPGPARAARRLARHARGAQRTDHRSVQPRVD